METEAEMLREASAKEGGHGEGEVVDVSHMAGSKVNETLLLQTPYKNDFILPNTQHAHFKHRKHEESVKKEWNVDNKKLPWSQCQKIPLHYEEVFWKGKRKHPKGIKQREGSAEGSAKMTSLKIFIIYAVSTQFLRYKINTWVNII